MKKIGIALLLFLFIIGTLTALAYDDTDTILYEYDGKSVKPLVSVCGLSSEVITNAPFKDKDDSVLHIYGTSTHNCLVDSSGKNYINTEMPKYVGAVKKYKKVAIAFDFMLTCDNTAVSFRGAQQSASITTYMKFMTGKDVNVNEWNRAALVLGADGNDNTIDVYLNGRLFKSEITSEGAYGFSTTGWIMCQSGLDCDFEMFLDNIVISGGNNGYTSEEKSEFLPLDSGYTVKDGTIMGINLSTPVSKIISSVGVSIEGSKIGIYDEGFNRLTGSDTINDGCSLVIVSPQGIYSHYKIESAMEPLLIYTGSEKLTKSEGGGITITANVSNAPDKPSDDFVYRMAGTATSDLTLDGHGKGYINLNLGNVVGNTKKYNKIAVIFDVYIKNSGTGVFFRGQQYNGSNMTFGKVIGGANVQTGRWNNIVYLIDGGEDAAKAVLYVNGEYVDVKTLTSGVYGFEKFGWILPYVTNGGTAEIYLDNISVYGGNGNYFGYIFPEIESVGDGYILAGKTIFGLSVNDKISDVLKDIKLKEDIGTVIAVGIDGNVLSDDDNASAVAYIIAQNNGMYTYYGTVYHEPYSYFSGAACSVGSIYSQVYADFPLNKYQNNEGTLYIDFGTPFVYEDSIKPENFAICDEASKKYAITNIQAVHTGNSDFCRGVTIVLPKLEYGTEYVINAENITYLADTQNSMMNIYGNIITIPDPTRDSLMSNIIKNEVSSSGWMGYGGLSKILTDRDETTGKTVLKTSGRTKYFHGIQQTINYNDYYKKTFDKPGETSTYHIEYSLFLPAGADRNQNVRVCLTWFVNGTSNLCVYDRYYNDLQPGKWYNVSEDINIRIPATVDGADSAWLRVHIEGVNNGSTVSEFYVSGLSIRKWSGAKDINININPNVSIGKFGEKTLGYAYEGGYWYSDANGAVVEKYTNNINPHFLSYLDHYDMKMIRIGGYGSNYDFWKADLGNIEDRLPTYSPAPEWSWADPDVEGYWRSGLVYTGPMEKLAYAEAIDKNASIIMCVNMWSVLPEDTDYNKKYEEPIYPERAFDKVSKIVDYSVLERITQDIIDYMRFCLTDPSEARATGTDGINWAQRRIDLGHEKPYNITIWELGNEFYLRGLSGKQYVQMCQYVIPKIKEVFPEVKLCIHVTNGYDDWMEDVILPLAKSVDFVSTHAYYSYSDVDKTAQHIENVQKIIDNSENKDLKIQITEGGLNTFRDYVGPSNQSIAMCTSFARFMSKIIGVKNLESFQYYGGPTQISYNYGLQFRRGWAAYGTTTVADSDRDGENVTTVSKRDSWSSGIIQEIPLVCFTDEDNILERTANYDISYDVMIDTYQDSVAPVEIKFEWLGDSVSYGKIYSRVIEQYESGKWNSVSIDSRSITIPDGIDKCEKAVLRVSVVGARTPSISDNGVISVKNFRIVKSGTDVNLMRNAKISYGEMYDDYRDTALGELMQYFINHAGGEVVQSYVDSDVTSDYVSSFAVINGDTLTLIVANTDPEKSYNIAFDVDEKYYISSKYVLCADDIYAQRNPNEDNIHTQREYYNTEVLLDTITIPKLSVVGIEIKNTIPTDKFSDMISFDAYGVTVSGTNSDKNAVICAVFTDDEGNVRDYDVQKADAKNTVKLSSDERFSRVRLYKWSGKNIKPLGIPENYISE